MAVHRRRPAPRRRIRLVRGGAGRAALVLAVADALRHALRRRAIGLLPLLLGAVALLAAVLARSSFQAAQRAMRTTALAWLSAVALAFVSVAIPLQLEKSWITIGWALEGVAVLYLWTRLEHEGSSISACCCWPQ
jgi:hypothetical protein